MAMMAVHYVTRNNNRGDKVTACGQIAGGWTLVGGGAYNAPRFERMQVTSNRKYLGCAACRKALEAGIIEGALPTGPMIEREATLLDVLTAKVERNAGRTFSAEALHETALTVVLLYPEPGDTDTGRGLLANMMVDDLLNRRLLALRTAGLLPLVAYVVPGAAVP